MKKSYFDVETFLSVLAALLVAGALFSLVGGVLARQGARLTGVNADGSNFDDSI